MKKLRIVIAVIGVILLIAAGIMRADINRVVAMTTNQQQAKPTEAMLAKTWTIEKVLVNGEDDAERGGLGAEFTLKKDHNFTMLDDDKEVIGSGIWKLNDKKQLEMIDSDVNEVIAFAIQDVNATNMVLNLLDQDDEVTAYLKAK